MWSYQTIRDLAFILARKDGLHSFQRTFISSTRDYRGSILLDAIFASSVSTDEEASKVLDSNATPKHVFRAFKFRFIEEILNCYLTLDTASTSLHSAATNRYRLVIIREAALLLDRLGKRLIALRILQRGVQLAANERVTDELFQYSYSLSQLSRIGSPTMYAKDQLGLNRLFFKRWRAEVDVEGVVQYADMYQYTNLADDTAILPRLESEIARIERSYADALTEHATVNLALAKIAAATLRSEVDEIDHIVSKTLRQLPNREHRSYDNASRLLIRKACSFLQCRLPERSLNVLATLSEPTVDDRMLWQMFHETSIVAHIHTQLYEEALSLWNRVDVLRKHHDYTSHRDHTWNLLGGYLALLEHMRRTGATKRVSTFRLRSFLNSLPRPLHPDLRIGLPFLTLEIVFAIANFDYDQAQRRIEYAVITVARTRRVDAYERYIVFAELLRDLITCRFDPQRFRSFSSRNRKRLDDLSHTIMPTLSSEIIPFDVLHDMIMDQLEQNDRQP